MFREIWKLLRNFIRQFWPTSRVRDPSEAFGRARTLGVVTQLRFVRLAKPNQFI